MGNCLRVRQLAGGALPGLKPLLHRAIIRPRGLQVVREQFWLPLGKVGEVAFQYLGDARVQLRPFFAPLRVRARAPAREARVLTLHMRQPSRVIIPAARNQPWSC
jgi:hypothetical protein